MYRTHRPQRSSTVLVVVLVIALTATPVHESLLLQNRER
jgi:hypothetical protein